MRACELSPLADVADVLGRISTGPECFNLSILQQNLNNTLLL
jgi:hypothetical protein